MICCLAYTFILTERGSLGLVTYCFYLFTSFATNHTYHCIKRPSLWTLSSSVPGHTESLAWSFSSTVVMLSPLLRIVSNFLLHVVSELNDSIKFLLLPLQAYQSNEAFLFGCFAYVCCVYMTPFISCREGSLYLTFPHFHNLTSPSLIPEPQQLKLYLCTQTCLIHIWWLNYILNIELFICRSIYTWEW